MEKYCTNPSAFCEEIYFYILSDVWESLIQVAGACSLLDKLTFTITLLPPSYIYSYPPTPSFKLAVFFHISMQTLDCI